MNIDREHQREAERGLLNLALIAAEDAALIAATSSPNDQTSSNQGENISMMRELGHRIAALAEAVEILRTFRVENGLSGRDSGQDTSGS